MRTLCFLCLKQAIEYPLGLALGYIQQFLHGVSSHRFGKGGVNEVLMTSVGIRYHRTLTLLPPTSRVGGLLGRWAQLSKTLTCESL